jgi:hypothetical protein
MQNSSHGGLRKRESVQQGRGVAKKRILFLLLIFAGMHMEKAFPYCSSDAEFDSLFPVHVRQLSTIHWTPLQVAFKAAAFLAADAHSRIIDVGAGAGKFCIAGSHCFSNFFTGIEQRKDLVTAGNKVISRLGLQNVTLICGNSTALDLSAYTGIYFYNSFHEHLILSDSEQGEIHKSGTLYDSIPPI